MSHTFDCVVDTLPMAHSVDGVSKHVDGTTTAVVAMQTAVVKAQVDGANHVCKKVNQGFYAMIHSSISQKMAALQSRVDAQLMRLNQQRKMLTAIRMRMERDYHMISARYGKIFGSLNRALRQRVTELDRPILDFAVTEADKVTNRTSNLVSAVPVGQAESVKASQMVKSAHLKQSAARAVSSMERFVAASNHLQDMTDRILLRRNMNRATAPMYIPVAVAESNYDASGNTQTQIFVSGISAGESRNRIENAVSSDLREGSLQWKETQADPEVTNCFRQYVANDPAIPQRVRDTMLRMFASNSYQSF